MSADRQDTGGKCERASIVSFYDKDPFPYYDQLRSEAAVHWDAGLNGWLILTDELCRQVETREDLFRTYYADATPLTKTIKGGDTIALLTGERHARARRFHLRLLSPQAVQVYRVDHISKVVNWLIDRFISTGRAELAEDLAYQVPTRMILSMMGMAWQNDELVKRIHDNHGKIVDWIGRGNPDGIMSEAALAAANDLNGLLMPLIKERQGGDADDLISRIWREAPAEYGDLDEIDVLAICRELLFAGADTSMQAIANTLYLLIINPDLRKAVMADDKALENFIEESLRLYPAAQWRFRIANDDTVLGGVNIAKNDVVISLKGSANRDPSRWGCPASVQLDRPRASDHITFNTGPRRCAGAWLARAEMSEVVRTTLTRLEGLKLNPDAEQPKLSGVYMQGFRPLNVVFGQA